MNWSEQSLLVTGGTGSFGKKLVEILLRDYHPKRLVIFSRDELKQHDMKASGFDHSTLRYFIGDVRDPDRLERALAGVTVVVHAAAIKHVPVASTTPSKPSKPTSLGGRNVINASINQRARRILLLSTDKAVNPINLYGPRSSALRRCLCRRMRMRAEARPGLVVCATEMSWAAAAA